MKGNEQRWPAARSTIALCCLITTGCAVTRAPTEEPVAAVPAAPAGTSMPVDAPTVVTPPEMPTAPAHQEVDAPQQPTIVTAAPSAPAAPVAPAARPAPATRTVPVAPTPPVAQVNPAPAVPPAPSIPDAAAAPAAAAPLDFASLGTRLRATKCIGVLTKLTVKNQADDLLDQFRAYHRQQGTATLAELRRSYDLLLLKVLSLLQDGDPPLAQDIVQSRAAIWEILADARKFVESNLMAGVTP